MGDANGYKLDVARRLVRAFEHLSVDEVLRVCDPEVELTTLLDRIGESPLHGRDGVRRWFERMNELWAFVKLQRWEYEEVGEWMFVTGSSRVRGKASPDELDLPWIAVARLGDSGLVDSLGLYLTRDEALEAIGHAGGPDRPDGG